MTKRCNARSIPSGLLGLAALVGLSAPAMAQSPPAAGQPPLMDREKEIALALSACPPNVASKAAVYVLDELRRPATSKSGTGASTDACTSADIRP